MRSILLSAKTGARLTGCAFLLASILIGCVEESANPVVFDQTLETTSFENVLFTPVILYRDGVILDTIEARTLRTYRLDRKGIVRHSWRILAPRDRQGHPYGVEVGEDLGIQYAINARYQLTNTVDGRSLFTPYLANLSLFDLNFLYANYRVNDEFLVNMSLPSNSVIDLDHAPYYYWNFLSNVRLQDPFSNRVYEFSRLDSVNGEPELEFSDEVDVQGSGLTNRLIAG